MTGRACSVDGCPRRHLAGGWCELHYRRHRRTGTTDDPRAGRPTRCAECPAGPYARGLCRVHYERARRDTAERCTVDGCERPMFDSHGHCQTHRRYRLRRAQQATLGAEVESWGYVAGLPLSDFVSWHRRRPTRDV